MDVYYWKHLSIDNSIENYNCNGKYLIFSPWNGGFNNIRMSFELACVIAFRLNRILVLPNPYIITHLNNIHGYDSFFDIGDIGIKTISINDFCSIHNITNNADEIKNISTVYTFSPDNSYINLTNERNIAEIYTKKRQVIHIDNAPVNIYFDKNLIGTFYSLIYDKHMLEIVNYVKKHIHYKEHLFTQAKKITEYLNNTYENFYALHIRRTDFNYAYKEVCITMNVLYNNIHGLIPQGACVYIATDSKNKAEFLPLREKYRLIFFEDILHLIKPDINQDCYGLVEQIICARGLKFIGTNLSTFSCYIYRLRGYMADINDKSYYVNTINYTHKKSDDKNKSLGWKYEWSGIDNVWSREFIDGFNIKNEIHTFNAFYLKYVKLINIQPQKNKKIISFSLYGTTTAFSRSRGFYKGIYVNYHLAKTIYPDWILRVYMPYNEPAHIITELSQFTNIELVLVDTNICLRALRFLPYDDKEVSIWLSRDLDSIVNEREKAAVTDWLTKYPTKNLHIMTDNEQHYWTIAGGMFGVRNNVNNSSSSLIDFILQFSNKVSNNNNYAIDCDICEQFFYKADDNYIQHYGAGKKLARSMPFPPHKPIASVFVGNIMDINNYYDKLNLIQHYPLLRNKNTFKLKNNDLFYYPPWNTNCVVNWYNAVDFTLTPIKSDTSTSGENSCLKTENGEGIRLLTAGDITISALWDGAQQKNVYISDENTLAVIHGNEHYYFTRV